MALRDVILNITLKLNKQASQQLQQQLANSISQGIQQGTVQATPHLNTLNNRVSSVATNIRNLVRTITVFLGGRMLYRFFEESIMMFARFDQKMQQSIAIMDNVDQAMKKKLGDRARILARELNVDATEMAEAYLFLAQSGMTAAQAFEAIPIVAVYAKAGMMNLSQATELLAQTTAALGYASDDPVRNLAGLARVADVTALAAARSQASIQEFATSLANKAGNSLRLFNKDVEEGVAVLSVLANQGVKGAVAGERLDMFLRQATQAAVKHKEVFKQYGIQMFDTGGNLRNLADIAEDLTRALGGLSDEQQTVALQQLGFQVRSVFAVKAFIGQADAIREYERALRNASGFAKDVADKQLLTPIEQWGIFKQRVKEARMQIGEEFIPVLGHLGEALGDESDPRSIVGQLVSFARWLKENPEIIQGLGNMIIWLVTTPFRSFMSAMLDLSDGVTILAGSVTFLLAEAFAILATAAGIALKPVGMFFSWISGGFFHELEDLSNGLLDLAKSVDKFAMSAGAATVDAFGNIKRRDFSSWLSENNPRGAKNPRLIDSVFNNLGPSGRDGTKGFGRATIPTSIVDDKRAEEIERLSKRLADMLAAHTETSVDNQMNKLLELQKAYAEIYGDKIPSDVQESFNRIRAAIKDEDMATAVKDMFKDMFKDTEGSIDELRTFIDVVKNVRDGTEDTSKAWTDLNTVLEEAMKLLGRMENEEGERRSKEMREIRDRQADEYEQRMRRIRRIGEHTADALADSFSYFYATLVDGSKRGADAFENMGRAMIAAMMSPFSEYFMLKARENFIYAAEAVAMGFKVMGNPFTAALAPVLFSAAAKHAAVGSMWAALGGGVGGIATSVMGNMHGLNPNSNANEPGSDRVDDSRRQGPDIHIYIDGVDPKNPRHQRLIGDTVAEWSELTGGNVTLGSRR